MSRIDLDQEILGQYLNAPMSRRSVLKRSALVGVAMPVVAALLAACEDDDDDDDEESNDDQPVDEGEEPLEDEEDEEGEGD